jgi:Ankyrin repeat
VLYQCQLELFIPWQEYFLPLVIDLLRHDVSWDDYLQMWVTSIVTSMDTHPTVEFLYLFWLRSIWCRISSLAVQNGHTALIHAANEGYTSVATLLLDAKADINRASNVRLFCILLVISYLWMSEGVAAVTDISCFSLCIDVKSTSWYSLRICASCLTINDETDLRLTVLYSVPIQTGMTALMAAANKGHASVMTLLLDAKADANLADSVRHA